MGMLEHLMQNPIEKEWLNIDKVTNGPKQKLYQDCFYFNRL